MNYDETGTEGPDFEIIGPDDDTVAELIELHPDWSDEQIAAELSISVWAATDARTRA